MDPLSNIWQVALALVVIVAVVYGLGFLARRMQTLKGLGLSAGGEKCIKILESAYLGPKERLVMVEVANKRLLLAVNAQAITKLSDVADLDSRSGFEQTLANTLERCD